MLGRRDNVVRLNPCDLRAHDGAGEQRVLSAIFEVAPIAWITLEVDAARQHHIETGRARFGADHPAAVESDSWVPGGGRSEARRERCALALLGRSALCCDANARIRLPLGSNSKTGYSGHEASRSIAHPGGGMF